MSMYYSLDQMNDVLQNCI